jgi:hypothetical protein
VSETDERDAIDKRVKEMWTRGKIPSFFQRSFPSSVMFLN